MKSIEIRDGGEGIAQFEPLIIADGSKYRSELNDLALELAEKSSGFRNSLPPATAAALSELVRTMNCYYSNLIEGHNTHPIDIERALNQDYSENKEKRSLQLEAFAHIEVQKWIDEGGLEGRPTSTENLKEMHKRFCELLPSDLLILENPDTGETIDVVPGEFRTDDVRVGKHIAISPGAVPRFVERLDHGYTGLGRVGAILAAACAHHRMLWVHPFADGNGRVARLMSYAMILQSLNTEGLWSVARGLARNVEAYKGHLAACDMERRNDLDGRGHLSEEALAEFTKFFLQTCIDQVTFMEGLMRPERLRDRVMIWTEEQMRAKALPPKSDIVLKMVLYDGEVARADITKQLGVNERTSARITSALLKMGVLTSKSTRAPLRLAFPATIADRWLPRLFPEKDD